MPYQFAKGEAFEKDFKDLRKVAEKLILAAMKKVADAPEKYKKIQGTAWNGAQKIAFGHRPEYRLIFKVYDCRTEHNTCRLNQDHSGHSIKNCSGLVDFIRVMTREEAEQLYRSRAKQTWNYFRDFTDDQL